jgi:Tfp pilus assembly protein PilF
MLNKVSMSHHNFREWLIAFFLILGTLMVFWPVLNYEFINYDDDTYVSENPHIQDGLTWEGIKWAFSMDSGSASQHADFWIPMTFISHMITIELFGLDPGGHHLVNLMIHIMNTALLFWALRNLTGALWKSGFVAALFAIHPLHIESVAWVTERKDVLSTLFWILTLWAYLFYTKRPEVYRYLLVAFTFSLGLMAKPMVMTLPFVLLLLDYWPLQRIHWGDHRTTLKRVLEKSPLIILTGICLMLTLLVQQKWETVGSLEAFPLGSRIGNALISYSSYIGKMFWPLDLAVLYPHPGNQLPLELIVGSALLLLAITILTVWWSSKAPYLIVGWLWFLGTLVPVIGLIQVGQQAMADRYTYIPLIGLFIIIAWGIPDLIPKWRHQKLFLSLGAGLILPSLMVIAWFQVQHWRNSISLFKHAIETTGTNYVSYHNLGLAFQTEGRFEEAIGEYQKAMAIKPNAALHNNMGVIFEKQGLFNEAIREYQEAVALRAHYARPHYNLANVYFRQERLNEAILEYQKAITITPNYLEAHLNLGKAYGRTGQLEKAIQEFNTVLKLNPKSLEAQEFLDLTYRLKEKQKKKE